MRELIRRLGRCLSFWWETAKEGWPKSRPVVNAILGIATAVTLLFGVTVVWPGSGALGPPVVLAFTVLLFLSHAAHMRWENEVGITRAERDEARRLLAEAEQDLDEVEAVARDWRLLATLVRLRDDRRITGMAAASATASLRQPLTDPKLEAMAQGKVLISLRSSLDLWSMDVQQALNRARRPEAARRFNDAGRIDPPVSIEKVRSSAVARHDLVTEWASMGSEMFPDLGREWTAVRRGRIRTSP